MNKLLWTITVAASTVAASTVTAAANAQSPKRPPPPQTLSVDAAIRHAARHNPTLHAALLDAESADSLVSSAEDQYPLMLQLDGGATHLRNPRLADPSVLTSTSDTVVLGSELTKTFPWGTNLGFRLEGSWFTSRSQIFPNSPDQVKTGPGYSLSARLTLLQPILRGAGTDVGEAEVRTARIDQTRAVRTKDRVASELLRDVLTSYWELWYADQALGIDRAARALADQERAQQQARADAGSLPKVEVYPFDTRVAELDEALLGSELERERRSLALGLQLGASGKLSHHLSTQEVSPPTPALIGDEDALVAEALRSAPELAELDAQIAQAEERGRTAGQSERHRLDLTGWMQIEGLGNKEVPPALEQFSTLGAFSAQVGLVYQFPLTGSRYSKQQMAARKAYDAVVARRDALEQNIENQLTTLVNQANAAVRRVELASRTVENATKQRAAAKERYELGDGLAIEIPRAEDTLQRARLRATRARVDWILAVAAIDHLTGRLLSRHKSLLPAASAPQINGQGDGPF